MEIYNIQLTVLTSLKVVFIYAAMKPGMIFHPLRLFFDWCLKPFPVKWQLYLAKPLYDCLVCQASFWTIIFTLNIFSVSIGYLFFLFQVGGLNFILSLWIHWSHDQAKKDEPYHDEIVKEEKKS